MLADPALGGPAEEGRELTTENGFTPRLRAHSSRFRASGADEIQPPAGTAAFVARGAGCQSEAIASPSISRAARTPAES